jgi:hypothetical protein
MTPAAFTFVHVLLSLIGMGSGLVVLLGLIARARLDGWTALFLATTVATSVTGFGFPIERILPSHVVGLVSLIVLAITLVARYGRRLAGPWRGVYVVGAALALYLNVFVAIVQAFLKVPSLRALAPRQTEPPFLLAQGVALVALVVLTVLAVTRFRASPPA